MLWSRKRELGKYGEPTNPQYKIKTDEPWSFDEVEKILRGLIAGQFSGLSENAIAYLRGGGLDRLIVLDYYAGNDEDRDQCVMDQCWHKRPGHDWRGDHSSGVVYCSRCGMSRED